MNFTLTETETETTNKAIFYKTPAPLNEELKLRKDYSISKATLHGLSVELISIDKKNAVFSYEGLRESDSGRIEGYLTITLNEESDLSLEELNDRRYSKEGYMNRYITPENPAQWKLLSRALRDLFYDANRPCSARWF